METAKVSEKLDLAVEQEKPFHPKGGKKGLRTSPRMEVAAKLMAESIVKNKPMHRRDILIKAGYSPKTAKNMSTVTQSQSFKECLEKYLPVHILTRRHRALVEEAEDTVAIKAIELGYRVRGHIVTKSAVAHAVMGNISVGWSDS